MVACRMGLSWILVVAAAVGTFGCKSQVGGGEGEVSQGVDEDAEADGEPIDDEKSDAPPEGDCDLPPHDPGNPSGPANEIGCESLLLGDGTTCLDPGSLKDDAYALCTSLAMTLTGLDFVNDCPNGGTTQANVICCDFGAPPDPGPNDTVWGIVGDGSTCVTLDALLQQATDICDAQGLTLGDFYTGGACGEDMAIEAKYSCVGTGTPPDPDPPVDPVDTVWGIVGDGSTCVTLDVLLQQATDICAAQDRTLGEFYTGWTCGEDMAVEAKYSCVP